MSFRLKIVGVPWRLRDAIGVGEHVADILSADKVFGSGYVHSMSFLVQLWHDGRVS